MYRHSEVYHSCMTIGQDLPAAIIESDDQSSMPSLAEDEETRMNETTEEMKIAWRYKDKPIVKVCYCCMAL